MGCARVCSIYLVKQMPVSAHSDMDNSYRGRSLYISAPTLQLYVRTQPPDAKGRSAACYMEIVAPESVPHRTVRQSCGRCDLQIDIPDAFYYLPLLNQLIRISVVDCNKGICFFLKKKTKRKVIIKYNVKV